MLAGISIMDSGPANNIRQTARACNCQPGFQRSEPRTRTNEPVLPLLRTPKPKPCSLSFDTFDILPSPACSSPKIRPGWQLAYPAGEDRASILPSRTPNNRRVRRLSANRSQ